MLCLGIGLLAAGSSAMAQTQQPVASTQTAAAKSPLDGKVKFKEENIDFGTAKLNKPVTVEFTFTNTGKEPLIIQNAQPSCGCTTPDWTKEPVMPGKKGSIKATYNAATLGQVNKTVFVNFKGIPQTVELHLRGKVAQ
ncbi:hypothetical protein GCM10023143_34820 [Compostibacter hankyongensis]|uniref:DUF1573 domain-containing protein n=2 Tax=Compostibacter hankyongensis TaxID=1007089 RepID=A0ABP8GAM8_9BACT